MTSSPIPDETNGGTSIEQRVSTLVGDRLCIKCGYNLTGQSVVREPHYQMLIVRCPECGTVASLQEYPLLGRWASRWAMLLAALWFAFTVLIVFASAGILYGFANEIAQAASGSHATWLSERQLEWLKEQEAQGTLTPNGQWILSGPGSYQFLDQTWTSQQDFDALLVEAGGWRSAADWSALGEWIELAPWAFGIGCFWAVALARFKRRWLIVFGLVPVSLAGVFAVVGHLSDPEASGMYMGLGWGPGWTSALMIVQRQVGPPFYAMTLGFAFLPLSLGLILGRSVVRGLIRALLPPRLRSSLALLWIVDGLEPPRARHRRGSKDSSGSAAA